MKTIKPIIYNTSELKSEALGDKIAKPNIPGINQVFTMSQHVRSFISPEKKNLSNPIHHSLLQPLTGFLERMTLTNANKIQTTDALVKNGIHANSLITKAILPNAATVSMNQKINFETLQQTKRFISYDTETLGGVGANGENLFDALVELAYTENELGEVDVDKALQNTKHYLFGINQDTYNNIMHELENNPGFFETGRGRVLANRLAIYGHSDTVIKGNQIIKEADIGTGLPSNASIINGLNRLRKAGMLDETTLKNGKTDGQRFLENFYNKAKSTVVAGHNILDFDHLRLGNLGFNMNDVKSVDTLTLLRSATQYMSKQELLQTTKKLASKTGLSQENISNIILGNQIAGLTAHTASVDSAIHSIVMSDPIIARAVKQIPTAESVKLEKGKALLYTPDSDYFDHSSLGFLHYPDTLSLSEGYTYKDGRVVKDLFKPGIVKKDGLYTYEGSGKMTLTKDDMAAFRKINADFSQPELYYVQLKAYGVEEDMATQTPITKVFRSAESMQKFIDSTILAGSRDKISDDFQKPTSAAGERMDQILTNYNFKTRQFDSVNYNTWLENTHTKRRGESAARKVRDFDLKTIKRIQTLHNELISSPDGVRLTSPIMSYGLTLGSEIAVKMQEGLVAETSFGFDRMAELLGHIDNEYSPDAKRLYYNTLDNMVNISPFYFKNKDLIDQVTQFVDETYKGDAFQQGHAYKRIMEQLVDGANLPRVDLNLNKEAMDYIEFDPELIKTTRTTINHVKRRADLEPSFIRINLNNNADFKLVDQLLRLRHGDSSKQLKESLSLGIQDYEAQGMSVLYDFAQAMNIDIKETYDNTEMLSNHIVNTIKERKKINPLYKIKTTTRMAPFERGEIALSEYLGSDITGLIKKANANVEQFVDLRHQDPTALSNSFVKHFTQQIEPDHFQKYFNEKDAAFAKLIYDRAQEEMGAFYKRFLDEFKDIPGMQILFDEKSTHLYAKHKDVVIDIGQRFMPQLKVRGDMAYIQLGNRQVALQGYLSSNGSRSRPEFFTNINHAVKNAPFSYHSHKKLVEKDMANAAEGIARLLSNFSNTLAETSDVGKKNVMNRQTMFEIDVNDVLAQTGVYAKSGKIQVTDEEREILYRFSNNGKSLIDMDATGIDVRNITNKHLSEMLYLMYGNDMPGTATYMAARYAKPFGREKQMATGKANVGSFHLPWQHLEPGNRITAFQNNFYSFNRENVMRRIQKYGEQYKTTMPEIRFGSNVTTKRGYELSKTALHDFSKLEDNYSNQVVVKKMTISHENFKSTLERYLASREEELISQTQSVQALGHEQLAFINQKLAQISLLEDETYVDARLFDSVFEQNYMQKIRVNKDIERLGEDFMAREEVLNYTIDANGVFHYGEAVNVKKGDLLLKENGFLNAQSGKLASYDGRLRKGFYSNQENIMLDEDQVNLILEGMDYEQKINYINENLNEYYYIERANQEPFKKMNVSGVEKTRSRAVIIKPGEYDQTVAQDLKALGLDHLVHSREGLNYIESEIDRLDSETLVKANIDSNDLMQRLLKERYMVADFIQNATGNKGVGLWTFEDQVKHGAISASLRETVLNMQDYQMKTYGLNEREASKKVIEQLQGIKGFEFELGPNGEFLLPDDDYKEIIPDPKNPKKTITRTKDIDFAGLKNVIAENYPGLDSERLYTPAITDESSKVIATISDAVLAQTEEYDLLSGRMPVEYYPSIVQRRNSIASNDLDIAIYDLLEAEHKNEDLSEELLTRIDQYRQQDNSSFDDRVKALREQTNNRTSKTLDSLYDKKRQMTKNGLDTEYVQTLSRWQYRYIEIENKLKEERTNFQLEKRAQIKKVEGEIKNLTNTQSKIVESTKVKIEKLDKLKESLATKNSLLEEARTEKIISPDETIKKLKTELRALENTFKKISPSNTANKEVKMAELETLIATKQTLLTDLQEGVKSQKSNKISRIRALEKEVRILTLEQQSIETDLKQKELKVTEIATLIQNKESLLQEHRSKNVNNSLVYQQLKATKEQLKEEQVEVFKGYNKRLSNKKGISKVEEKISKRQIKETSIAIAEGRKKLIRANRASAEEMRIITQTYTSKAKGHTYDERTLMNLRNKRYTQSYLNMIQKNTPENILNGLGIADVAADKPLLSAAINGIIAEAVTTSDKMVITEDNLDEIINFAGNESIAKGIINVFENNKEQFPKMAYEIAETRYSLSQMEKAWRFNEGSMSRKEMLKSGFKAVDINEYIRAYYYDKEYLNTGNSIYGNNLLLRVGNKEIAVPFTPHSTFESSIVQKQYERNILALRDAYVTAENSTGKERREAEDKIAIYTKAIQRGIKNYTAKDGPLAESLKTRSKQSVTAKSTTLWERPGSKHSKAMMTATHNGESIAHWLDNNAYVNAAFGSEAVFEEMGLGLESDFWNQFKNGEMLYGDEELVVKKGSLTRDQRKLILQKYGVEGLSTRFPVIQEGSTTASKLYLDTTLDGNQMKLLYADQIRKAGDNDGDLNAFMALRYNADGKFLNSIQLNSNKNLRHLPKTAGFNQEFAMDAVGPNKFLSSDQARKLRQQNDSYISNYLDEIAQKNVFGSTVLGAAIDNPYFDIEGGVEGVKAIDQTLDELSNLIGPIDYTSGEKNPDSLREQISKIEGVSSEDITRYENAVKQRIALDKRELTTIAKVSKTAIGEINLASLELKSQAETLMHAGKIDGDDFDAVTSLMYGVEQDVISIKNAKDLKSTDRTRRLKKIMQAAYQGDEVEYNDTRYSASEAMGLFLDSEVKGTYVEKYGRKTNKALQVSMLGVTDEAEQKALAEASYEKGRNAIVKMMDYFDSDEMRATNAYFRQFTRYGNTAHFNVDERYSRGVLDANKFQSVKNTVFNLADQDGLSYTPVGLDHLTRRNPLLNQQKGSRDVQQAYEMMANTKVNSLEKIAQSLQTPMNGKRLAVAALATTGAYMLMGAVGNSVTANTTNQAEQQEETFDGGDTLSDYGYTGSYQAPTQPTGYVINVNAKTQPRNIQPMIQRFNQSITNTQNANASLTLNINELPLKDFQITQLIEQNMF